jgi:hypothetical protein
VQHGDHRVEVPVASGGEERVDNHLLTSEVALLGWTGAADATPGAAGELAGRLCRAFQYQRDLLERHVEHVVQHIRQSLGWAERLHYDLQRAPDPVGEQRLVLGVRVLGRGDDRFWDVPPERLLTSAPTRADHVQGHARDDRRQPRAKILDLAGVRSGQSQPSFLDGIVRLRERAKYPVGHRPQMATVFLKALGQPLQLVHRSHSARPKCHTIVNP